MPCDKQDADGVGGRVVFRVEGIFLLTLSFFIGEKGVIGQVRFLHRIPEKSRFEYMFF